MSYIKTLILNQQYRPHDIVGYRDAIGDMFCGKIEVIVQYDEVLAQMDRQTLKDFPELRKAFRQVVGTDVTSFEFKVPAVAVLLKGGLKLVKKGIKFGRRNVYERDKFRCQYCGEKFKASQLNYDHVIPRGQGGVTTWTNIVAACYPCNGRKANRTPEQAGMRLLSVPRKPLVLPMNGPVIDTEEAPVEWKPYLVA